ncbi:MAG: hypothetical protein ACOXZR_02705 [Bacilli bacterium]|jgi:hypothetical protein
MGLFDRIKNLFYEEEEIEVPKESLKVENKDSILKSKKSSKRKESEIKEVPSKENVDDIVSERELFKSESTFKFPIIFEEEDFLTEKKESKSINVLNKENTTKEERKPSSIKKKEFMPTPIISPVYGVLGKNYEKKESEGLEDNMLGLYEKDEDIDIDTVIEKAYSREKKNLQEEKVEEEKFEETTIDLFTDLKDEEGKEGVENEIVFKDKTTELNLTEELKLKSIDELLDSTDEQDFYKLVDSMYEKKIEEEE